MFTYFNTSTGQDINEEDEAMIRAFKEHVEPEHQPPIKIRGVPAKYANAAYINGSRENSLDKLEADLEVRIQISFWPYTREFPFSI